MGENDGTMLEALTGLCQERLFTLLMEVDTSNIDGGILAKLARAIGDLARASINVKKHVSEARAKALEEAATIVEKTGKSQGASTVTINALREAIRAELTS